MRTAPLTLLTALVAVLPAQAPAETKDRQNLVEIAVAADDFNTLVAAVKAAGLVETLSGKGPFTIFAPTDAAFAKLGKKTINDLLKPENKGKLAAILTYHVAGANMPAGKVIKVEQIETLQKELSEADPQIAQLPASWAAADPRAGQRQMAEEARELVRAKLERAKQLFDDQSRGALTGQAFSAKLKSL